MRLTAVLADHHRLTLFWTLAGLALAGPWLLAELAGRWSAPPPAQRHCNLTAVHDGDTMRLTCDGDPVRVRLYCIDAPELAQAPWGADSRAALRELARPALLLREHDRDHYGRIVGEVSDPATGASLNLELVAAGMAAVYPQYCDDARFFAAQADARAAGSGIWATAGDHQAPWLYRQR